MVIGRQAGASIVEPSGADASVRCPLSKPHDAAPQQATNRPTCESVTISLGPGCASSGCRARRKRACSASTSAGSELQQVGPSCGFRERNDTLCWWERQADRGAAWLGHPSQRSPSCCSPTVPPARVGQVHAVGQGGGPVPNRLLLHQRLHGSREGGWRMQLGARSGSPDLQQPAASGQLKVATAPSTHTKPAGCAAAPGGAAGAVTASLRPWGC